VATLKARYHPADARGRRAVKGFYVVFHDAQRRPPSKEVPTGTKDERTARARQAQAERAHAHGLFDPWTDAPPWKAAAGSGLTVVEAVERFVKSRTDARTGRACTPVTVANYRRQLGPFVEGLPAGLMLAHLARGHVERFLGAAAARGVRPATVESYANRVRVFCAWCRTPVASGGGGLAPADWQPETPAPRGGRAARGDDAPPKFFTPDEIARLMEVIEREATGHTDRLLCDAVPFTAGTGLRLGEVCALRWADIVLPGEVPGGGAFVRVVSSDVHRTKSGRGRVVPLVGAALAAVLRRRQAAQGAMQDAQPCAAPVPGGFVFPTEKGAQVPGAYLSRRFARYVDATFGREDRRNFHSLRHTFGTAAVGQGVSLYQVQGMMGHSDATTTQTYARHVPTDLHAALSRAFGDVPGEGPVPGDGAASSKGARDVGGGG